MKQTISLAYLKSVGACSEAIKEFAAQEECNVWRILDILIKKERWEWFNWFASRLMTHKQKVRWAIFCAEQVLGIFEEKYPADERPRGAIEAAKHWLKKPSKQAAYAAYAAYSAANAAYSAAANNAAAYAAYSAANAAFSAANAAYSAAAYAAAYAAYSAAANAAAYAANAAANAAYSAAYAAFSAANSAEKNLRIVCAKEAIKILSRKK